MTESAATVIRQKGDYVWLSIQADCSACSSAAGCGLRGSKDRPQPRIRNGIGAKVGDAVIVSVPDGLVLKAAALCYVLPLAATLGGAITGDLLAGDSGAVIGGLLGIAGGWLGLRAAGRGESQAQIRFDKPTMIPLHRYPT